MLHLPRAVVLIVLVALGTSAVSGCAGTATTATTATAATVPADTASPAADDGLVDIGGGLRGPAGAAAAVQATGLTNVAAFAIDAEDRLWAGTAAYTDAGSDVVAVLDADDPGVAPKTVVSGLHTVLGLAWSDDTLYVASAGRVDAYSDFDGASFAATRSVITFPAGTGEVNGLAMGPDGRLRVGISAPCDDCSVTDAWSGSVVSVATDGSDPHIEASGIRAPVGLAYLPGTDDLFVTMNQRDDLGESTPGDWLAVAEAGQDWGFPECYGQGGTSCTNAPSPVAVLDPHAAVSGVALAAAGLTGDETIGPVAIVAEWARGLVLRVDLRESSGTWTGAPTPFLTGVANPVAVAVDSDGAVLVGDWTSGTIYRVVPG